MPSTNRVVVTPAVTHCVTWVTLLSFLATPFQATFAAPVTTPSASSTPTKSATIEPSKEALDVKDLTQADDGEDASSDANGGDRETASDTILAPGFLLQLSSSSDAKLNGAFRIQLSGRIELPYNVSFNAKGMTLTRFRAQIAKAYADYFNGKPNVRVVIKQRRYWVEVLGLVAKPGEYLLKKDSPLDEIVSSVGGLTEDLTTGYIRIVQGTKTSWINLAEYYKGHATVVPNWIGADRIFFQRERPDLASDPFDAEAALKIQVLGEIRNPGELTFRKDADFYYYLVKTGGPTTTADLDEVEIVRADRRSGKRESFSRGSIEDVGPLQGGDIVLVHPTKPNRFEKTLTITSIITSIVTASLLAYVAVKQSQK